jgi:hypothetical protein
MTPAKRRKGGPPLRDDLMDTLHTAQAQATPPRVPFPLTATPMQLARAVAVLAAGFLAAGVLAGLFLRLVLFVAGI